MSRVVRSRDTSPIARWTRASVLRSRFAVASSSSRIAGSTSSARARQISWRCPAESERPRSVTGWRYPPRSAATNSCAPDRARGALDLLVRCVGTAVGDVVADGPGEEERLLGHVPESPPVRVEVEVGHRDPVDEHPAGVGVVEARHQLHQGGLARAGLADQRDRLARCHLEVDAVQRLPSGTRVREVHVLEADRALERAGGHRRGGVGRGDRREHELVDLGHRRHRLLPLVEHL